MKPINKLLESTLKLRRSSRVLSTSFRRNSSVEIIESNKILKQRKRNQEERFKTFRSAIDAVKQKEQDSGNKTNALLGGFGLSALVAGGVGAVRGRKPGMGVRKPGTGAPRSSRVPTGRLRRPGALPKGRLPRVGGPLNAAFAGVDFAMRKGSGQTNLQAGVGAGAGLLGSLGGMKAGAAAGGAIGALFGGVGAIPGAAIGGLLGSFLGGSLGAGIADNITGADGRRKQETQRTTLLLTKSSFGRGLDSFESALNKLDGLNDLCNVPEDEEMKVAVVGDGTPDAPILGTPGPTTPFTPPVSEPITSGRGEGREAFRPNREQEDVDLAKIFAIAGSVALIAGIGAMVAEPSDPIGLSGALPALSRFLGRSTKIPGVQNIKPQSIKLPENAGGIVKEALTKSKGNVSPTVRPDSLLRAQTKMLRESARNMTDEQLLNTLRTTGDKMLKKGVKGGPGFDGRTVRFMKAIGDVMKERGLQIPDKFINFMKRIEKIDPSKIDATKIGPTSSTESSGSDTIAMIPFGEEKRQQQMQLPPAGESTPVMIDKEVSPAQTARYIINALGQYTA